MEDSAFESTAKTTLRLVEAYVAAPSSVEAFLASRSVIVAFRVEFDSPRRH
jgi:hypothetical protein